MPAIKTFRVGSTDLQLHKFNLEQTEEIEPLIERLKTKEGHLRALGEAIAVGLRRGNPAATLDWVRKEIDFNEMSALWSAILAESGLQPVAPGEAPSP